MSQAQIPTPESGTLGPSMSAAPLRPVGTPLAILRVMADPMRHAVLREMAEGSVPSVMVLAKRLGCHPDMMGRHLQRLQKAGLLIRVNPGKEADQRSKYYQIPSTFRQVAPDGTRVLDFGSVVLRFEPRKS